MMSKTRAPSSLLLGACVGALYTALGVMDLTCSLTAFRLGVSEANPIMAWMGSSGLFVPGKLILTAAAALPIGILYYRNQVRPLCWLAISVLGLVDLWHIAGLAALAFGGT